MVGVEFQFVTLFSFDSHLHSGRYLAALGIWEWGLAGLQRLDAEPEGVFLVGMQSLREYFLVGMQSLREFFCFFLMGIQSLRECL